MSRQKNPPILLDRLLRADEVLPLVGLKSRQGLHKWIMEGKFPEGIIIGTRGRAWPQSVVENWRAGLSTEVPPTPRKAP
jgi:predicted DNA-binding transcriptional regulator AlpA